MRTPMKRQRLSSELAAPRKSSKMRRRIPRGVGLKNEVSITCKRQFRQTFWQPSTAATSDFWKIFWFKLTDLPTSSEFTNLFDEYRFNAIKVVFRPRFSGFDGANTTDSTLPGITNQAGTNLHIALDPKGSISPSGAYSSSSLNLFMENDNIRSYNGNRAVTVYYKPTVMRTVDGLAAEFKTSPWLSTSYPAINHFGFSAYAQDFNFNGTFGQSWDIFVTYYMSFRGLK